MKTEQTLRDKVLATLRQRMRLLPRYELPLADDLTALFVEELVDASRFFTSLEVWAVIPCAVFNRPPMGIFTTEEEAVECARRLWERSDGHHTLEVWRYRIGEEVLTVPLKDRYWRGRLGPFEPVVTEAINEAEGEEL